MKYTYKKARFYYAMYLMKERAHLLTNTTFEKNRIRRIISDYNDATFGIDISHYQDFMVFDSLSLMHGSIPIEFVVMRATMGKDGIDRKFNRYWQQLENQDFIRGAYHYYRPWESPELQAKLFLDQIELKKGDLRPVLDIEKIAKNQSKESLVADLQIWLNLVEEEYQTKPIIYTYYHFYKENLENQFDDYPLWIANYNDVAEPITDVDWQFWQFTENGILPGVPHKVDINIFNGGRWQLLKYTLD
ncbi:MAG: GH25 family lysozyme [Flavobacteriaceae bacterium]|nr:GH25 family lysozyme [Flavobacteriaceae bacterium]